MTEVTRRTAPLPAASRGGPDPRSGEVWLPVVRVAAVALTVVVVAAGVLLVVCTFFQRQTTETRPFAGAAIGAVQVGDDVGDVRVRVALPGEDPGVTARITDAFDEGGWSARLNGRTLVVSGACDRDGFWFFNCSVDLTLVVPAGIPVDVESNTGDVTVDGAFSVVRAQTTTGDVLVRGVGGPVVIRTNTGDVRSLGTRATAVTAESTTGDVRLVFDVPPRSVNTETTTGDVTVLVPDDGSVYGVATESTTGDEHVEVGNVAGSPNQIVARTTTGDVRVGYR